MICWKVSNQEATATKANVAIATTRSTASAAGRRRLARRIQNRPSRIVPETESVHLRFKADPPGWEAAVWLCPRCGHEMFRRELDASAAPAQEGYWQACQEFNRDASLRNCRGCGASHSPADLTDIKWPEVAELIRAEDRVAG